MATILGKRKSRKTEDEVSEDALAAAQAVFQRHFEASFAPLEEGSAKKIRVVESQSRIEDSEEEDSGTDAEEDDAAWDGVSNEDDEDEDEDEDEDDDEGDEDDASASNSDEEVIEVVSHTTGHEPSIAMSKREARAFMSSRPPTSTAPGSSSSKPGRKDKKTGDDQDEDSRAFLANDLALQRLIAESHILSRPGGLVNAMSVSSSPLASSDAADPSGKLFAAGRIRRMTTEMRLERALGRDAAVPKQTKMPMAMRQGIARHAADRDEKRRREARESGIVLERKGGATGKGKGKGKSGAGGRRRGEAPVDMPSVGKMRGSELRLSARDVRSIQGPTQSTIKRKKKRR